MHLAGASVFLVDFSYGVHKRIRDARSEYSSFEIPVAVEIIDAPEKIEQLLVSIDPVIEEGLVVRRPARVVHYAGRSQLDHLDGAALAASAATLNVDSSSAVEGSKVMKIEGEAQRLTVYVGNKDTWHGRNLATVIVEKCRELGMAGATATVGAMGFGKTSRIHRAHLLGLSEDLPERIEVVDHADRIAQLLPSLEPFVQGGLIVLEDVRVVHYRHSGQSETG
jgi:PII-like signaling protein